MKYQRRRTNPKDIAYSLYLYFLGLSYRSTTAKALSRFVKESRFYLEMDTEIQTKEISSAKTKVSEFIIDETQIQIGSKYIWLWVAIEPDHRQILYQIGISFERNMLIVAERFIFSLINKYGK